MTKRKRITILIIAILCLAVVIAALALAPHVAISFNMFGVNGCNSIAFDKKEMLSADKVILRVDEKSYTVTDQALIQEIAEQTLVATCAIQHCNDDCWIELYQGDQLIRRMNWGAKCHGNQVLVYEADDSHWISQDHKEGFVLLSNDLEQKLISIIEGLPD